ncbi:MAG: PAS domain-containing protein [Gemmataceae bacterium]
MKRICAWCNKELGFLNPTEPPDTPISHGICPACMVRLTNEDHTFRTFLNSLDLPIFVVDPDGRILIATEKASALVGTPPEKVEGNLGGDALECAYSRRPGGCGNTMHCKTCTIRQTVESTFATGTAFSLIPAYLDKQRKAQATKISFLISTELVNDVVLLQIHELNKPSAEDTPNTFGLPLKLL